MQVLYWERRNMSNERKSIVCAGQILVDGSPMRCKVRHLTASSAIVQTPDARFMPATFGLRVLSADVDTICQVVWRDARRLGVTFLS